MRGGSSGLARDLYREGTEGRVNAAPARRRTLPYLVPLLAAAAGAPVLCLAAGSTWPELVPAALPALVALLVAGAGLERMRARKCQLEQLVRLHQQMTETFSRAIDARDARRRGHARRVAVTSLELGRKLVGRAGSLANGEVLDGAWLETLNAAALLHDIGQLGLPDHLLREDLPEQGLEQEKFRHHAELGAAILREVTLPRPLAPLVRHHHERWDGRGYPDGLAGEAIPLGARIIAVGDQLELLRRTLGRTPSRNEQVDLVARLAGSVLDPQLADLFCRAANEILGAVESDEARRAAQVEVHDALDDIGAARSEVSVLYDLARQLGQTLDLSEMLPQAVEHLGRMMPVTSAAIFLEADGELTARAAHGPLAPLLVRRSFAAGEGHIGWAFLHGVTVVNEDPRTDLGQPGEGEDTGVLPRAAALVPLGDDVGRLGLLALYAEQPAAFTDDHRRVLDSAGAQLARALRNALRYEAIQRSSLTDPLTGIPNSRFLYLRLEQELARAIRGATPLTVAVMDLDGFKGVNDRHGHQAGDLVLRRLAAILCDALRTGDTVCRYAGDEFVALLPETTVEESEAVLSRLKERVRATGHDLPDGTVVKVGISVGAAAFPEDGSSLEELIHRADKAMYRDKTAGRELAAR
jgi:diguanylate cyclase (GGDEF)-like protein/putative nucleotidyltransferase with HDIG domain